LNVSRSVPIIVACYALQVAGAATNVAAQAASVADVEAEAVVVLIAAAQRSPELGAVLSELLLHRGVRPQFIDSERFEASALLDTGTRDPRVWVFVVPDGDSGARLFFRGPFAARFLLRELSLRNGLDEVGRELIGRVVESSTVALLRSGEGMSRAQAEQGIALGARATNAEAAPTSEAKSAADRVPEPESEPVPERDDAYSHEHNSSVAETWLLAVRGAGHWTGNALGAHFAAGLEAGRTLIPAGWPRLRVRAAFEWSPAQTLARDQIAAEVRAWPLRVGLDLGFARGAHALLVGLSTGIDVVRTTVTHADDASLRLATPRTQALPVSRAELRYELAQSWFLLSAAVLIEVPWQVTDYDLSRYGKLSHLGTPWQVRPGLAISCGARL
jgi:hypothetical protein